MKQCIDQYKTKPRQTLDLMSKHTSNRGLACRDSRTFIYLWPDKSGLSARLQKTAKHAALHGNNKKATWPKSSDRWHEHFPYGAGNGGGAREVGSTTLTMYSG